MAWLVPKAVFDGTRLRERTALHVVDDAVAGILPVSELSDRGAVEFTDRIVGPGLLDIQVNGGGGVMLNNAPTPSGVRSIAEAHRRLGTSLIFPTIITDRFEVTEKAARAVLCEFGRNGVAGIHIEGPHINPLRKGRTGRSSSGRSTQERDRFSKRFAITSCPCCRRLRRNASGRGKSPG